MAALLRRYGDYGASRYSVDGSQPVLSLSACSVYTARCKARPQRGAAITDDISNSRYIDQPLIFVTTVYNRCP